MMKMRRNKQQMRNIGLVFILIAIIVTSSSMSGLALKTNEPDFDEAEIVSPPDMELEGWNLIGQWSMAIISGVITDYNGFDSDGGIYFLKDVVVIGDLNHVDFLGRHLIIRGLGSGPYVTYENKYVKLTAGRISVIGFNQKYGWNDRWYVSFRFSRAFDVKLYE